MIDDFQASQLVSGGDCPLHWHSVDQQPSLDTLRRLQQLEVVVSVSAAMNMATDSNTRNRDANYVRVDSTSGTRTITLPAAKNNGRRVTIARVAGANTVTVAAQAGETVSGTTSITTTFAPVTFKAISTTAWEQV